VTGLLHPIRGTPLTDLKGRGTSLRLIRKSLLDLRVGYRCNCQDSDCTREDELPCERAGSLPSAPSVFRRPVRMDFSNIGLSSSCPCAQSTTTHQCQNVSEMAPCRHYLRTAATLVPYPARPKPPSNSSRIGAPIARNPSYFKKYSWTAFSTARETHESIVGGSQLNTFSNYRRRALEINLFLFT
jgi:hypothetical protein